MSCYAASSYVCGICRFGRVSIRIGEPQSIVEFANGRKCVRTVNRALAYSVSFTLQSLCEIMPTHMVATLLLMFRRGISRAQLVSKLDWLRREILTRGGRVILFETQKLDWIVAQSLELLRDVVEEKRQNFFEAKIWQPGWSHYPSMHIAECRFILTGGVSFSQETTQICYFWGITETSSSTSFSGSPFGHALSTPLGWITLMALVAMHCLTPLRSCLSS